MAAARSRPSLEVVLFDLGGVLIELQGTERFATMLGLADPEAVWDAWLASPWVRRFEAGACSPEAFVRGLLDDHDPGVAPDAFLEAFRRWPVGPFEGAFDLVRGVREEVIAACLSNTNAVHWADQEAAFGWSALFQRVFLSHEMGKVKPDADAFRHVLEALDVPAPAVLFLDDNAANVEGARAAGLDAHQVRGVEEARRLLAARGLLRLDSDT